jgi:hypothetical protein
MKFEPIQAFAVFGASHRLSLQDPDATENYIAAVRQSLSQALEEDHLMHGLRTQALFEALVASLGRAALVKREDTGDIYVDDDRLRIPDLRLILSDKSHLMVEVKNYHQKRSSPFKSYKMRSADLDGHRRYADLMQADLKVAVYWSQWNIWTLSSPVVFKHVGNNSVLSFEDAAMANEMALVGDKMIGTTSPLVWRVVADRSKPRSIDTISRTVNFTIGDVKLLCQDREITRKVERNIAWFFLMYGDWRQEEPEPMITDGLLEHIDFVANPDEESGQGFDLIGSLSSMFSSFYLQTTSDEKRVKRLLVPASDSWGKLIPDNYKGGALPIWQIIQQPNFDHVSDS